VAAHGQYRALPELLTQNVSDCEPPFKKDNLLRKRAHVNGGISVQIRDTNPCISIISTDLRTYSRQICQSTPSDYLVHK
jgi:hypothetical protein